MAPEIARLALPTLTDPVKPGDAVGSGVLVAPVPPVAPAGVGVAGETLPVGDASGDGPGDSRSSPPHATSRINAAVATMRLERTRAPFERLTVTQRQGRPASTDARCSLTSMLDRELVEEVLHAARRRGGSFAELFVEEKTSTSIRLDDGKVEELTTGLDRGAGVRVVHGDVVRLRVLQPAGSRGAARRGRGRERCAPRRRGGRRGGPPRDRRVGGEPASSDPPRRCRPPTRWRGCGRWTTRRVPSARRSRRSSASTATRCSVCLIATSDGLLGRGDRARGSAWWRRWSPRATGTSRRGSTGRPRAAGPSSSTGIRRSATAEVAARRAVTMLDSVPAPAGEMTVVLAPGMGGVLFHEAVGHPLESDAIDKEASVYRGLVGERCASELIDGVDDATIPNGWGSYAFDDEATPSQRTSLFEKGVLQGLLYDRMHADKDGSAADGERAQAVIRVAADPADDEHQYLERHVEGRRHRVVHRERRVRDVARRRPDEPGHR